MLINLNKVSTKINDVLHIGAYLGEELSFYEQTNAKNIFFFEPQKDIFQRLTQRLQTSKLNCIAFNCALGSTNEIASMNISEHKNDSSLRASSSILKPKLHLTQHPDILFNTVEKVQVFRFNDIMLEYSIFENVNFINLDVQGYELQVLMGATNILPQIKYILCEVNNEETYENCPMVEDIDSFLSVFDFQRIETVWSGGIWGDALYENSSNFI